MFTSFSVPFGFFILGPNSSNSLSWYFAWASRRYDLLSVVFNRIVTFLQICGVWVNITEVCMLRGF